jgi:hypothetical protein
MTDTHPKPFLFLDVDGCLSPLPQLPDDHEPGVLDVYGGFPDDVRFDSRVPGWLKELGEHYELVWGSTWGDMANKYLSGPLGLGELDYVQGFHGTVTFTSKALKLGAVLAYLDQYPDRPAAWIDDYVKAAHRKAFSERGAPSLALGCKKDIGITQRHVNRLLAFAKGLVDMESES